MLHRAVVCYTEHPDPRSIVNPEAFVFKPRVCIGQYVEEVASVI